MKSEELLKLYAAGQRRFGYAKLAGVQLGEVDLSEIDLEAANLTQANLEQANLSNAKMNMANLSRACLNKANLSAAKLPNALLARAELIGVNLSGAVLKIANLAEAQLSWVRQIEEAESEQSWKKEQSQEFEEADVDIVEKVIAESRLNPTNLSGADLSKAIIVHADLREVNLNQAKLSWTNLSGARLSGADLSGADLYKANLTGADLSRANLRDANLTGVDLSGAILTDADFQGAIISHDHNQGLGAEKEWNELGFRSNAEIKIAAALDARGVMFFPNCKARITTPQGRQNREPDFLVCYQGNLGILEVDAEPWQPASSTALDHERDRHFKFQGIRVVEHYDAIACLDDPDTVVEEFLAILSNA